MFTPRSTTGLLVARFLSVDFAIAMSLGLWHLLGIGTCASGGPFEIANQCTDDAMTWGLVFAVGLTGGIITSFFTGFAWGWAMMFVPAGATATAFALVGDPGLGSDAAAWTIGPLFLLMGLPVALYAIKEALTGNDTAPDEATRRNAENYLRNTAMVNPYAQAAAAAVPQITVTPPAAKPATSTSDHLARLDALKATGALTDTEYALERSRLALGSSREIR